MKSADAVAHDRARPTAYGGRVTIDPGLPVALAALLLLALTVTMYRVGRLPSSGSTVVAAVRAIVQLYVPKILRYKGVLYMAGSDRKVIFQGVHQLMGSDLGPKWAAGEKKQSKIVFIGIDLPKDVLLQGLEQCLV